MNFRRILSSFVAIFYVLQVIVMPVGVTHVAALNDVDKQAIENDWTQWVADNGACRTSTSSGDTSTLSGKDNPEKAFNFFIQKGLTTQQSAAFVGNFMQESSVNPAANQPNGPGRGIAQWSEGGRWDHDKDDNLQDFAKSRSMLDLATQLDFVWYELTSTDFKSVLSELRTKSTLADMTQLIATKYEIAGVIGPRLGFAEDALTRYGKNSVATNTSTSVTTGCVSSNGAAAGDIVQTALNYAWDTRGHGFEEADAKPTYRRDMPIYNGATDIFPFSDCGVFVSTVMIASGTDKDYPKRSTTVQLHYLESHPDKYQEIKNVTSTSQLEPGDVLVNTSHTYFYVGAQPKGFNSVGASLHTHGTNGHVPQASGFYDGFSVFRVIKSGSATT